MELKKLIKACCRKDRASQKRLYEQFYAYAITVCLHYARDMDEARDMAQEGFFKLFTNLHKYNDKKPFKAWFRRILVNAAIDYYRKNHKHQHTLDVVHLQIANSGLSGFDQLALDDVLELVQRLPPMYRMVFNLSVMEGYSHDEISQELGISIGGSKSNLSRAKAKLREMIRGQEKKVKWS